MTEIAGISLCVLRTKTFDFEKDKLELEWADDTGWDILPDSTPCEIPREEVDDHNRPTYPPKINLKAVQDPETRAPANSISVKILGISGKETFFLRPKKKAVADSHAQSDTQSKDATVAGKPPCLMELLHLGVLKDVGTNYGTFGTFLLKDGKGSKVENIESQCQGNPENIVRKILTEWLQGRGESITWSSFVEVLRYTGLHGLADKVESKHLKSV
jgi:hypothetical protein